MDFYQARSSYLEVLDAAQAELPGPWEASEPGARPCTAGGLEGANMFTQRIGPGVEDGGQRDALDRVAAVLAEHGYPLTVVETEGPSGVIVEGRYPDDGTDEQGLSISVIVSPGGSTISGTSACGTGDPRQINQDRQDEGGYPGE